MQQATGQFMLRTGLAQQADALVQELLELLRNPYDEQPGMDEKADKRPDWARDRPGCSMLSCSS